MSAAADGTMRGMAVTDEAILRIKEMILAGELAPGDRLPPEKELSERLGLSRSSLREAVKALEVIRVLDVRRGDGTYVTSLEPRLLLEAMSFVVDLHDDQSVLEIFAVRRILEPAASALAARNADDDDDRTRCARWSTSVDHAADVEDLVAHDLEFHRGIAEADRQHLPREPHRLALEPHRAGAHLARHHAGERGRPHPAGAPRDPRRDRRRRCRPRLGAHRRARERRRAVAAVGSLSTTQGATAAAVAPSVASVAYSYSTAWISSSSMFVLSYQ